MVTLVVTALALVGWTILPESHLIGIALTAAGLLNLVRLARWRGWATTAEPLVLILHLGYLWLGVGLVLVGAAAIWPQGLTASAGLHALTAGAVGVMTLAVMTRAGRGHTGRPLTAGWSGSLIYILINLAALARVVAGLWPSVYLPLLIASACLWCAAFIAFAVIYAPMLALPRPRT
jgi:uncharacterized protein involved in response to NO